MVPKNSLRRSRRKHIYVYVHGCRMVLENRLLVATELWHFLGYDGALVAYAWPATTGRLAYFRDTDTSSGYARNFRKLIEYLAEETNAEEIHVIGFSAGTRMMIRAFEQLAMRYHDESRRAIHSRLRIGNLILIASDMGRVIFGVYSVSRTQTRSQD